MMHSQLFGRLVMLNCRVFTDVTLRISEFLLTSSREFQPDDSSHDQSNAAKAQSRRRFAEKVNAKCRGADSTDAGPDGVRRANRLSQREAKQGETERHGSNGEQRREQPGKTLGVFQSDRPPDFKQSGEQQIKPRHDGSPLRASYSGISSCRTLG